MKRNTTKKLKNKTLKLRSDELTFSKYKCFDPLNISKPYRYFFSNFHISTHIHTNNKLNHLPLCHTWILLIICSVSILLDWSLSITSSTAMSVTSLFAHWWIALPWSKAENYVDSFVLFLLSPGYIYAISLSLKQPIGLLVIIYLNYFKIILNVLLLNKQNKVELVSSDPRF